MERIIFYVLPLFVLLVVYLAFKLFKNRSLYLAAAAENERLQAEIDAQQKFFCGAAKAKNLCPRVMRMLLVLSCLIRLFIVN